ARARRAGGEVPVRLAHVARADEAPAVLAVLEVALRAVRDLRGRVAARVDAVLEDPVGGLLRADRRGQADDDGSGSDGGEHGDLLEHWFLRLSFGLMRTASATGAPCAGTRDLRGLSGARGSNARARPG